MIIIGTAGLMRGGGASRSGGVLGLLGVLGLWGMSLLGVGTGIGVLVGVLTGASVLAKSPRSGFFGLFM